jgi:N4-gp56 family major capsid protein
MADQITDIPEVEVTRMDYIVEMVQRELAAAAKLAPTVRDVSEFALPGHKSISFPKLGSFSVQKLSQNQKADAQALTATEDQLDLDQMATVQWILKRQASEQSRLNMESALLSRAASSHGRQIDIDILDEIIPNAAGSVSYNASDIEANILEVVQDLDEQFAPEEDRFMVFRPAQKTLILGVANFVQANRYGDNTPIMTGELGMAYGLRFIMNNNTTSNYIDGVMVGYQREGLALGFQIDPEFGEQDAIEYGVGSKRQALDQLYGVKSMQGGAYATVVA